MTFCRLRTPLPVLPQLFTQTHWQLCTAGPDGFFDLPDVDASDGECGMDTCTGPEDDWLAMEERDSNTATGLVKWGGRWARQSPCCFDSVRGRHSQCQSKHVNRRFALGAWQQQLKLAAQQYAVLAIVSGVQPWASAESLRGDSHHQLTPTGTASALSHESVYLGCRLTSYHLSLQYVEARRHPRPDAPRTSVPPAAAAVAVDEVLSPALQACGKAAALHIMSSMHAHHHWRAAPHSTWPALVLPVQALSLPLMQLFSPQVLGGVLAQFLGSRLTLLDLQSLRACSRSLKAVVDALSPSTWRVVARCDAVWSIRLH